MSNSTLDTSAPVVNVPIELLERVAMSVERIHERMLRTSRTLKAAGVPFAVIGGNAVAIWVESVDRDAARTTKDVDIVIRRSDLSRAAVAMAAAGFELTEIDGVTMFLEKGDPMPSRAVRVLFVGEKVRPHYRYSVPPCDNLLQSVDGVPAIGLDELLVMKLQSNRACDRAHVIDLYHIGLLSEVVIQRIPQDLQPRLREIIESEPV